VDDLTGRIRMNIDLTLARIVKAVNRSNRGPEAVQLVIVTKGQPVEVVQAAIMAGAKILGENYAEEAIEKKLALEANYSVKWHMIGHVQSRKADLVAGNFGMIHSLDSLKLAGKLEQYLKKIEITMPVLLEFNVGGELTKFGWQANEPGSWDQLVPVVEQIQGFPHLKVSGLMTMSPYHRDPERSRSYFINLRRLRDFLSSQLGIELKELSMGTSFDFEIAVEEGATLVRVGEAIVGKRHNQ